METQRSWAKRVAAYGSIAVFRAHGLGSHDHDQSLRLFLLFGVQPGLQFPGGARRHPLGHQFFLPHMILPPTLLLQSVRVAGSVLFLLGLATFTVCALQVYLGKIFKWGIA